MSIRFLMVLAIVALAIFANVIAADPPTRDINRVRVGSNPLVEIAPEQHPAEDTPGLEIQESQSLGFDDERSAAAGLSIGTTTYDYQSNGRMNRQIDWRATEMVHFVWTRQELAFANGDRGTAYQAWDDNTGAFVYIGGCDIHPRLGPGVDYSGYNSLDVDTESRAVIANHYDQGYGFRTTLWYDYFPAFCFFAPYSGPMPDTLLPDTYIWPSHEYQVWGSDTITHVFAMENTGVTQPQKIAYFRRMGSYASGFWDYPGTIIDTTFNISQTVTSSRVSSKVALVWLACLPTIPGDPESETCWRQNDNDLYYMISNDMGATWGPKINVTQSNPASPGWRGYTDLSCLIDSDNYLHIVWNAREYSSFPPPSGSFPHYYGSRLFHWEELNNMIRTVKDANWNIPPTGCHGGAWNEMSIVKPMISECDGKFYTLFAQFNSADCHLTASRSGAANGELYISISDNGGFNWDISHNLTNTPSPNCDHTAGYDCESDMWPSMSRYGMEVISGDFSGVQVVDPSGSYSGNYFLDVQYINDIYPGGCVQDDNIWTTNSVNWFRVPCVDPIPAPTICFLPIDISWPAWTKPGIQLDTNIRIENIGNVPLNIVSMTTVELNGPPGWLDINNYGPLTISHLFPNYFDLTVSLNVGGVVTYTDTLLGYIIITSDAMGGSLDTFEISVIVDDTVYTSPQIAYNIEQIFDSVSAWNDWRLIEVTGNYIDTIANLLVTDFSWYLTNQVMPAKSALLLTGMKLPLELYYDEVKLHGYIDSVVNNPYPYYPGVDTILVYFNVTDYFFVSENEFKRSEYEDPLQNLPTESMTPKTVRGPCDYAILLSGGVSVWANYPRYWNLLEAYYSLLIWQGYNQNNIFVIYFEGTPGQTGVVPGARVFRANQTNIDNAFTAIINDMNNNCSSQESSFFLMTFNHGAGNGDICLLGSNGLTQTVLRSRVQSVLDAGCDNAYVVMGQCFSGQPALELKNCNTSMNTRMYVTSDANENVFSWSRPPGDVYLEEIVAELYMNNNFENAMVAACEEYYDYLLQLQGMSYNVTNELADRSIVWKRDRFHQYGNVNTDYATVAGFPDGKCEFQYYLADWQSCGNTTLYELITGSWTFVAGWNFNTSTPNLNIYNIAASSQGLLRLVSGANDPFTITSSSMADRSHHWKDAVKDTGSTPSNIEDFAGFSLGWNDNSSTEFGTIIEYTYSVADLNVLGFKLSDMPAVLGYGSTGVEYLDVTFPIPEYNQYWTDMEIILDIAEVISAGNLTITLPDNSKRDTTILIDQEGVYRIPVGEIPDNASHTISFDASGCVFSIDAWKLNSLVPMTCCDAAGDANHTGNVNILDITYLIAYLYLAGPPPPCLDEGDPNATCSINILDITYLIGYLYMDGPPPVCGCAVK